MYDVLIVKYKTEPLYKGKALIHDNTFDNIGFSKAVNILLKQTKNDVILLNPDAYPISEGVFERLETSAYSSPFIGIVQPRMIFPDGSLQCTGHTIRKGSLGIPIFEDRKEEPEKSWYRNLESASFGCVFIKRKLINSIGLLDERFFLYYEDVDYCFRARKRGWTVWYCPEATVIHQFHGTTGGVALKEVGQESYLKFLKKHYFKRYLLKRMAMIYLDRRKT